MTKTKKSLQNFDKLTDWHGFQQEFRSESDRAAAIVGAALLDAQLEQLIASFLIDELKEIGVLFDFTGPFGSFGARIRVAFSLGLVSRDEYDDLKIIQAIRNDFAHHLHGLSFAEQSIKDRCFSLRIPKKTPKLLATVNITDSPRDLFMWATLTLKNLLDMRTFMAKQERREIPLEAELKETVIEVGA